MFPTLDSPHLAGNIAAVEQCSSVESAGALVRNFAGSLGVTVVVLGRLLRRGGRVDLGPVPLRLDQDLSSLARLMTFDVMRARESWMATNTLLRRREMRGTTIVFPHASLANVAVQLTLSSLTALDAEDWSRARQGKATQLFNTINQQHRISMRQGRHHRPNIERTDSGLCGRIPLHGRTIYLVDA